MKRDKAITLGIIAFGSFLLYLTFFHGVPVAVFVLFGCLMLFAIYHAVIFCWDTFANGDDRERAMLRRDFARTGVFLLLSIIGLIFLFVVFSLLD